MCIYDVAERVMLRRTQISANRSLDGVLDMLNSGHMTDAGPLQLLDTEDEGRGKDLELLPPSMPAGAEEDLPGNAKKRPVVRAGGWGLHATTFPPACYCLPATACFTPHLPCFYPPSTACYCLPACFPSCPSASPSSATACPPACLLSNLPACLTPSRPP